MEGVVVVQKVRVRAVKRVKRESVLLCEAVSRSMFVIELIEIEIETLHRWRNGHNTWILEEIR
jgi:hypothetical protein